MILPYILTIWCMNIIIWDYESVWPPNKYRSLWHIFNGPVISPYILPNFGVCTSYFGSMNQYDQMFDLKINVGHCDLYSMVQWFCLISWLFDLWTLLFGIMSQYDLQINIGHYDIYLMVQWFQLLSCRILVYVHHTLGVWINTTRRLT